MSIKTGTTARIFILKKIDEWKTLTKQTIDPLPIPPWPPPSSLLSLFQRDEDGVINTYEFQALFNIESNKAFQDPKKRSDNVKRNAELIKIETKKCF